MEKIENHIQLLSFFVAERILIKEQIKMAQAFAICADEKKLALQIRYLQLCRDCDKSCMEKENGFFRYVLGLQASHHLVNIYECVTAKKEILESKKFSKVFEETLCHVDEDYITKAIKDCMDDIGGEELKQLEIKI